MKKSEFEKDNPCVVVHGGAGQLPDERAVLKVPHMKQAVQAAWDEIAGGKPAEFGVAAALRVMEGSDYFNAGYGGYPNANGIVLLDLGLMRGNRDFVSLLNVRKMKYPSAVALDMLKPNRTLMSVWTHELMQEVEQAPQFIKDRYGYVESHQQMLSPVVQQWLDDDGAEFSSTGETTGEDSEDGQGGTVGCVVRDFNGVLAAGTSTGGVNAKENGRIGDTPIIGSGVFADDEIAAISTTGYGEALLQGVLSGFVLGRMRELLKIDPEVFYSSPSKLQTLLEHEFKELSRKCEKRGGGMIIIPPLGPPTFAFNTQMISVAVGESRDGKLEKIDSFIAKDSGQFIRE